jgi:SAM-dependent methyltransferase
MPTDAPDTVSGQNSGARNDASDRDTFEKSWQARFVEFATLREDDAGIAGWSTSGLETRFRFFRSLWQGAAEGALYLDVGCGAGTYSRWLADEGVDVIGVDYSRVALVKAKLRKADRIAYCASDAGRLPFKSGSVEGALCFGVLQAVRDSRRIVDELARVVRPGGEVWIDALNAANPVARWDRAKRGWKGKPMHLRYELSSVLLDLMRGAGFEGLSRHWLVILPRRLYRLHPVAEGRPTRWLLRAVPGLGPLMSHSFVIRGRRSQSGVPLHAH